MRIQHNIPAMSAYRNYTNNISAMKKNLEKLSSGYKINRAGDDAAGLAISEKMRAQITGLETAQKNAKDGISLVQTAEGALTEVHDMLNRMVELATQSANGTYDDTTDRDQLQKEMDQLRSEINRIADSANFNGIKLLDGSMDAGRVITTTADSAISEITTSEYAPKSASDAFESTFVTNRPEAATSQTNATFVVSLDDFNVSGVSIGDTFSLNVGGTTIEIAAATAGATLGQIIDDLISKGGFSAQGITAATNGATAATNNTTEWWTGTSNANHGTAGKYVEIDGNVYEMTKATAADGAPNSNGIKFTQVNFGSENVNPDYAVSFSKTPGTGSKLEMTGTQNPQVQVTTKGIAVGTSHQAQVTTTIDFTKLKDGDTFTVGGKNFVFAVGKDSDYKTATTIPGSTATYTAVNLSDIFKEESDLLDAAKQADAMVKITEIMKGDATSATSGTWTAGNQGVSGNIGTLTFQSLSSYVGDGTTITTDDVFIGGITANGVCDMRTEASVMKQFYSGRQESGAKLSFDIDVTKIKAGQTFTIDGKTFEFVDGAGNGTSGGTEIDLSNEGIAAGILKSQTATVMEKIKDVLGADGTNNGALLQSDGATAKYKVTYDGSKMTLSTKDDTRTPAFENRVAGKMTLPTETTTGKGLSLQIGDTSESFNQLKVNIKDCHTAGMGIDKISIADQSSAQAAVSVIKNAINYVSDVRGTLGATQNRLDHTINNLAVMTENIQDAESTIRDVDVAEEMMAYTKNNILIQSAQAMLAQANQMPQGVLQLLQ